MYELIRRARRWAGRLFGRVMECKQCGFLGRWLVYRSRHVADLPGRHGTLRMSRWRRPCPVCGSMWWRENT